ncbi:YcjF family protein [Thalassotalea agariperforans]
MSDDNNSFHQQILFDEPELKTAESEHKLDSAIVFNNQDYQDAQLNYQENEELLESEKKPRWLWRIIIVLLIIITSIETTDFLLTGFSNSPIITSIYALLIACLSVLAVSTVIKEFRGLRLLKRQDSSRAQAKDILSGEFSGSATQLCKNIHQQLSYDLPEPLEHQWLEQVNNGLSEQEIIQLYDLQILSKVDQKAIADIAKYSSEAMVLVAISPLALMDMMIMVWRNIRMIDKISGLYGLKLGYWSRIKLIKQVFSNMIFVGASEVLVDLGTEALGADLLGKFSGRLAQGFGAGMLTARLGLNTIKTCRPLPFIEQAPQLSNVRKSLLTQVKALLIKSK